jgi:hypothetical protein
MRTAEGTEMTKLTDPLRSFANAAKTACSYLVFVSVLSENHSLRRVTSFGIIKLGKLESFPHQVS